MTRAEFRSFFLSLRGHVLIYGTAAWLAMTPTMLWLNYEEGTLTWRWAMWILLVSAVMAIAVGPIIWFAVMRPLIKAGVK